MGERESPDGAWVSIGRITAPHGLRGAVRVYPLTDVPDRFAALKYAYVHAPGKPRQRVTVERAAYRKQMAIVYFQEITDIDAAEALRDAYLQVPKEEVAPLPEDAYYVFELIGLDVWTDEGVHVGRIADVLTPGVGNDVYVVERERESEVLIPAVKEFVVEIDLPGSRLVIRPIPGLL